MSTTLMAAVQSESGVLAGRWCAETGCRKSHAPDSMRGFVMLIKHMTGTVVLSDGIAEFIVAVRENNVAVLFFFVENDCMYESQSPFCAYFSRKLLFMLLLTESGMLYVSISLDVDPLITITESPGFGVWAKKLVTSS